MTAHKKGSIEDVFSVKATPKAQVIKAEKERTKIIFSAPKPAKIQFDLLAAGQGKTKQDLMCEALNDLFHKYGKPTIA